LDNVLQVINASAVKYSGIIPADRYHEPYMSARELKNEIASGVLFYGYLDGGKLLGVMGIQDMQDVALIRHAYVAPNKQRSGIGTSLLEHLRKLTNKPILIGTWADAGWAISFYRKHGFDTVTPQEKEKLLRKYWNIPERQVETSVVLADEQRFKENR